MKAQINLFHPNTSLIFMDNFLMIRVSLCVSKEVGLYLKQRNKHVIIGKKRVVTYLTYSTINYSKENIVSIQKFLLRELMILIRKAKCDLMDRERVSLERVNKITSKQIEIIFK